MLESQSRMVMLIERVKVLNKTGHHHSPTSMSASVWRNKSLCMYDNQNKIKIKLLSKITKDTLSGINNYLPWIISLELSPLIFSDVAHLPSCTSSGLKLQLCKVSMDLKIFGLWHHGWIHTKIKSINPNSPNEAFSQSNIKPTTYSDTK